MTVVLYAFYRNSYITYALRYPTNFKLFRWQRA